MSASLAEWLKGGSFILGEHAIVAQVLPRLGKGGEQVGEAEAVCLAALQEVIEDAGLLADAPYALGFIGLRGGGAEVFEEGEGCFVVFGPAGLEELPGDGQGRFAAKEGEELCPRCFFFCCGGGGVQAVCCFICQAGRYFQSQGIGGVEGDAVFCQVGAVDPIALPDDGICQQAELVQLRGG